MNDKKCACGCGMPVKYDFVKGHYAKLAVRKKFLENALVKAKNHPDCYADNPESKCRICKIKKELNKEVI